MKKTKKFEWNKLYFKNINDVPEAFRSFYAKNRPDMDVDIGNWILEPNIPVTTKKCSMCSGEMVLKPIGINYKKECTGIYFIRLDTDTGKMFLNLKGEPEQHGYFCNTCSYMEKTEYKK